MSVDQILSREVVPTSGFQSSVDYKQIIGLGTVNRIDSMFISWPDRTYSSYVNVPVDTVLGDQSERRRFMYRRILLRGQCHHPLLSPVKSVFDKHTEDDYDDFYYERNLPEILSKEGPKAAVGDVNGDGLPDHLYRRGRG